MKKIFEAFDGTRYNNEAECINHEVVIRNEYSTRLLRQVVDLSIYRNLEGQCMKLDRTKLRPALRYVEDALYTLNHQDKSGWNMEEYREWKSKISKMKFRRHSYYLAYMGNKWKLQEIQQKQRTTRGYIRDIVKYMLELNIEPTPEAIAKNYLVVDLYNEYKKILTNKQRYEI